MVCVQLSDTTMINRFTELDILWCINGICQDCSLHPYQNVPDSLKCKRYEPGSSLNSIESGGSGKSVPNALEQQPSVLYCLEAEEEDQVFENDALGITAIKSRLSKTLPEILADKGALGYFFQFLEAQGSVALLKFWLEVECVCGSYILEDFPQEKNACWDETSDQAIKRDDSPGFADNNDNYRCNVTGMVACYDNSLERVANNHVNSNDIKSNCDESPKLSEMADGAAISKTLFKTRKDEDAAAAAKQDILRIYRRYFIRESLGQGLVPVQLLSDMESALDCSDLESMLKCLCKVQRIVCKVLDAEYIDDFLRSDFHCKHQIDVLTSGNVQLADILYNETAFFHFMEFMEIEGKRELLDFWMSAANYKQNLLRKVDSIGPMEAQTDALIVYDKYFSLQATMPLGFSNKMRFQVEGNICREDREGPKPDCFDRPCEIVYRFLNKHYLAPFLSSQLYYTYLSELISTVQSSPCTALHSRLQRKGSDCSSEVSTMSFGTQSVMPMVSDEASKRQGKRIDNPSMSIDTRQLYDPDSLWKRQKYNLSVGYVNTMGRFVTEIDPDPHRKYESRLSRAMKRLVNMENDKDQAKEEMAWKIAEMIVREITSLTLGVSRSHLPS